MQVRYPIKLKGEERGWQEKKEYTVIVRQEELVIGNRVSFLEYS